MKNGGGAGLETLMVRSKGSAGKMVVVSGKRSFVICSLIFFLCVF
jgi:hypothetical protein